MIIHDWSPQQLLLLLFTIRRVQLRGYDALNIQVEDYIVPSSYFFSAHDVVRSSSFVSESVRFLAQTCYTTSKS